MGNISTLYGNTFPEVHDSSFGINLVEKGLEHAKEFLPLGNDIFIIHNNNDKVGLIRDGALKKYSLLDVNPSDAGERGLVGLSSGQFNSISRILLGYIVPESDNDNLDQINKIVFLYDWNRTGLEFMSPKRIIEIPSGNGSRQDTGTMLVDKHNIMYLAADNILAEQSNYSEIKQQNRNCASRLIRIPIEKELNMNYISESTNNTIMCFKGRLHGLAYEETADNLGGIQSFTNERDKIILINIRTNKTDTYQICMSNSTSLVTVFGGEGDEDKYCPTKYDRNTSFMSLAFMSSKLLGHRYANHLFVADSHGSIYDVNLSLNRGFANSTIPSDLFASGLGQILEIQASTNGLYVLSAPQNSTSANLYLISPNKGDTGIAELSKSYEDWSLVSTFVIICVIIGIALVHNNDKIEIMSIIKTITGFISNYRKL